MTAVSIAIRYVAVAFNVYLTNKIGASAIGLFTLISSVYGFALTLATSGISLATTKLVSEALGGATENNRDATVKAIMKKSLFFSFIISLTVSIALYLLAPSISEEILKDIRTLKSLRILSFTLVPIAISSSISGYFIAIRSVQKNAAVQVLGQAVRIFGCIYFLSFIGDNDIESACIAIVAGGSLAELIAFLMHLISYLLNLRKLSKIGKSDGTFTKKLIPFTLPIAFSAYVRSALVTIEHLLIPWGLEKSGSGRNASLAAYGVMHSVIFPFVLFPAAISSSFAGLLVPEISESAAAKDNERIERIIARVLKTVLLYSIGVAGIMICLSSEFGNVMKIDTSGAKYILLISPLVPVMYLDTSVDSILKGLGHQLYCMIINILDALMSVILVFILLPRYGIMGYVVTVYFTELVNAFLSITKLLIVTKTKFKLSDWLIKPLVSIIISTSFISILFSKLSLFAQNKIEVAAHVSIIAILYLTILCLTNAISFKKIKKSIVNFIKA